MGSFKHIKSELIAKKDTLALFLLRKEFPMDQAFFRDSEAQLPDYFKPTGALTP